MLRGDLHSTPLAQLLRQLADAKATGCICLLPPGPGSDPEDWMVGLRSGAVCSVTVPGSQESIATRLLTSGKLTHADLAEAREAQYTELSNWTLTDLLIHLGLAPEQYVHDLVRERALSDLAELCDWTAGSWRFHRRQRSGSLLVPVLTVSAALAAVSERQAQWNDLLPVILGSDAVVSLAPQPAGEPAEPTDGNVEMDSDGFALLCSVDGTRTVEQLGAAAGFTLLAAGRTIATLVEAGLVAVAPGGDTDQPEESLDDDASTPNAVDVRGSFDALAAAFAYDPADQLLAAEPESGFAPVAAPWRSPKTSEGDPLSDALARVSAALSDAMIDRAPAAPYEPGGIAEPALAVELAVVNEREDEPLPSALLVAAQEPVTFAGPVVSPVVNPVVNPVADPIVTYEASKVLAPPPLAAAHDKADASRLLTQLAGEEAASPPEAVPDSELPPPPPHAPRPRREDGLADTAALLRELSSLGTETSAPVAPVTQPPHRPMASPAAPAAPPGRKRKGRFGR